MTTEVRFNGTAQVRLTAQHDAETAILQVMLSESKKGTTVTLEPGATPNEFVFAIGRKEKESQ